MSTFGTHGNCIKVASGKYVDLLEPDPATIDIESIGAALGKLCRFGGHCPRFYSVAEHCIHAAKLALDDGYMGEALRAVFLHDAAEAYVGDMVRPLKMHISEYHEFEARIEKAIEARFNIQFEPWRDIIKKYDQEMLKTERYQMWPLDKTEWAGMDGAYHVVLLRYYPPNEATFYFDQFAQTLKIT
jgi:hypothetical protein